MSHTLHNMSLTESFATLLTEAQASKVGLQKTNLRIKELERSMRQRSKAIKQIVKDSQPKRKPSGFLKPSPVPPVLCDFMGVARTAELSRVDVNRFILDYIANNNLQNPADRRKIIPDETLRKLFGMKKGETFTYLGLQSKVSPLYLAMKKE